MKKKLIVLSLALLLTACSNNTGGKNRDASSTEVSTKQQTTQSSKKDSSNPDTTPTSTSSITIETTENLKNRELNPTDDVSKTRRQLYEQGINSSTITDKELKEYISEAKEQKKDVIDYIKQKINQ